MPWCPKCLTEYIEGVSVCAPCGEQLTDEMPEGLREEDEPDPEYSNMVFLASLSPIEAKMVEGLLASSDIQVLAKDRFFGECLKICMGYTSFGVDIFVPQQSLDEARELLNDYWEGHKADSDEKEADDLDRGYQRKRRIIVWIPLALTLAGIIAGTISILLGVIQRLVR